MAQARSSVNAILLALGATGVSSGAAIADLTVCNRTSFVLETAYGTPEDDAVLVEGWRRVRPGECRALARAPLAIGDHFLYARSSSAYAGRVREWRGEAALCVDQGDFSVSGYAACDQVGLAYADFRRVPVTQDAEVRLFLSEPASYDLETARTAGLQRLLRDAGYGVGRIDGLALRRTRSALTRFRRDAGLSSAAAQPALIDALEESAGARSAMTGLSVCDRADGVMWVAAAFRAGERWESRGWWRLTPGACVKVLAEPLEARAYYLLAEMENGMAYEGLAAADEPFCVADVRFSVLGRESCELRGYRTAQFLTVLTEARRSVEIELSASDFAPNPDLRR
ncbi:MAG: DUF1036 domain-containing protein [Maricaulaceae bacterium]